jgi:L-asparagine oxygenase
MKTILDTFPRIPRPESEYHLELTDAERSELGSLAEQLAQTPPGLLDDAGWLDHARDLSCSIPVRLMEAVRRYRHDSGQEGTLFAANLPIDESALPKTPEVRESVERGATVPAAVSMLIGLQLGELVAYSEEKAGALVQNVIPVRGLEESQSNSGSTELELHVENAFHPHRPDYIGLMCLRNDHAKKAGTLVASMRQALPLLRESDREVLQEMRFVTAMPPSFRSGGDTAAHAVLDGSRDDPNVRLDLSATTPLDDEAKQVLERLRLVLAEVVSSLVLQSGEMAFLDNHVVLHGRTHFLPRYDGRDRWLHRVYVHLDNRLSKPGRVGNSPVVA